MACILLFGFSPFMAPARAMGCDSASYAKLAIAFVIFGFSRDQVGFESADFGPLLAGFGFRKKPRDLGLKGTQFAVAGVAHDYPPVIASSTSSSSCLTARRNLSLKSIRSARTAAQCCSKVATLICSRRAAKVMGVSRVARAVTWVWVLVGFMGWSS